MKPQIALVFLITMTVVGCASTHPGREGATVNQGPQKLPMKISAVTTGEFEGAFQVVEVTIENTGENWLRIDKMKPVLDPGVPISVVVGRDLKDWADAVAFREKLENQNRQALQAGIVVVGATTAAVGGATDNRNMTAAGLVAVTGVYGWMVSDSINQSIRLAEKPDYVPDSHVMSPFNVPAKMFLRKWILLNKPPKTHVNKLVLEVNSVEGERELYAVEI